MEVLGWAIPGVKISSFPVNFPDSFLRLALLLCVIFAYGSLQHKHTGQTVFIQQTLLVKEKDFCKEHHTVMII